MSSSNFSLPPGFDSLRDFMQELFQRETWMVLAAFWDDSASLVRLLCFVIKLKEPCITEHAHFPVGVQDGFEWYGCNDASKDITVDVVVQFLDRSLVEGDETRSDLPTLPYRVGFVFGWLFGLIIGGNVLQTQEVIVSTLASAPARAVIGPPLENDSPKERSTPHAKRHALREQRQLAAPGRQSKMKEEA